MTILRRYSKSCWGLAYGLLLSSVVSPLQRPGAWLLLVAGGWLAVQAVPSGEHPDGSG